MKLASFVLFSIGCSTYPPTSHVDLDEPGQVALADGCLIVVEAHSLVCVPRDHVATPTTLATTTDRTYLAAAAATGDAQIVATSFAGDTLRVEWREISDGSLDSSIDVPATTGGGAIAVEGDHTLVSTGAGLLDVGGATPLLPAVTAIDAIGAVALHDGTAYYIDGTELYALASGAAAPADLGIQGVALAASAGAVVVGTSSGGVTNLETGATSQAVGAVSRVALDDDANAYALVDGFVYAMSEPNTPLDIGGGVHDLATDIELVFAISESGVVTRAPLHQ